MTTHSSGRRLTLRERLAKQLRTHGITVAPEDFYPALGGARSGHKADLYRWEAYGRKDGCKLAFWFTSFSTMSDCARYGVTVNEDNEVEARLPP